jgi:DNA-binding MarR family transcriptional regulator
LTIHTATQLSIQVLKKFRIIYGSVNHHFREIEKTCGITGSQLWILHEVSKAPGIGITFLAECMSIHQSTCSQLVEKMVGRGFIIKERSKEDQRRVGLCLSAKGAEILVSAPGPAEGILPVALQSLSEQTLISLDQSLVELINILSSSDHNFADTPLADLN